MKCIFVDPSVLSYIENVFLLLSGSVFFGGIVVIELYCGEVSLKFRSFHVVGCLYLETLRVKLIKFAPSATLLRNGLCLL